MMSLSMEMDWPPISLKQKIRDLLRYALHQAIESSHETWTSSSSELLSDVISVKRIHSDASDGSARAKAGGGIVYISAIALQLSRVLGQEASTVAHRLVEEMYRSMDADQPQPQQSFGSTVEDVGVQSGAEPVDGCTATAMDVGAEDAIAFLHCVATMRDYFSDQDSIRVSPEGWIIFSLSEIGLMKWLQQLFSHCSCQQNTHRGVLHQEDSGPMSHATKEHHRLDAEGQLASVRFSKIMVSQYAHARCCAWLRIANDQGVQIPLVSGMSASSIGDAHSLWMHSSSSTDLVLHLLDSVDDVCEFLNANAIDNHQSAVRRDRPSRVEKVAEQWSIRLGETVLAYQAQHPFIGSIRGGDRHTVEGQLSLIQVMQRWLHVLLTNVLRVQAPDFF